MIKMDTIKHYVSTFDIYPDIESSELEFKTNLVPGDKIITPICAFLNTNGGTIICGIDDETRKIKGIDKTSKHIDDFMLNIDTIYHLRKIISDTGKTLGPKNIQTTLVNQKDGKPVIIIKVMPDMDTKYQTANGNIFYRVNASNYKINTTKMYTEYEVQTKVNHTRTIIMKECKNLITCLQKQTNKQLIEINKLNNDNIKLQNMLFCRILEDKKTIDDKIHFSFCCGIIKFFFN
jgi:predicted HTH transcriptional regulator